MEPISLRQPKDRERCNSNPFCSTEISFWPEFQTGAEFIFAKDTYEQTTPSLRLVFYNKGRDLYPDIHGRAFGFAPLFRSTNGSSRNGYSAGGTLRLVEMESKLDPPFWGALGLDLSLHGGRGQLDLRQDHQHWKGTYDFVGADAALHFRLYFLTGYFGGGLRIEDWPTPQGDQKVNEKKIFPALLIGGGIP